MSILLLSCILVGACIVGLSSRGVPKAVDAERIGGALLVLGLVGLGFALSRAG